MLLKRRPPRIDTRAAGPVKGFEHLDQKSIAVLRWLNANRVEYVLVGAVAEAVRGRAGVSGPVAIVPSPYRRNFDRLARALWSERARLRIERSDQGDADTLPAKITGEKLARGQRWTVRCGACYDLDIEGRPDGTPDYQELLYEAARYEVAVDVRVEVAAPEDIERYSYIGRTGIAPEIRISRQAKVEQDAG